MHQGPSIHFQYFATRNIISGAPVRIVRHIKNRLLSVMVRLIAGVNGNVYYYWSNGGLERGSGFEAK